MSIVKYIDKPSAEVITMGFRVKNRKTYLDLINVTRHVKYLTIVTRSHEDCSVTFSGLVPFRCELR